MNKIVFIYNFNNYNTILNKKKFKLNLKINIKYIKKKQKKKIKYYINNIYKNKYSFKIYNIIQRKRFFSKTFLSKNLNIINSFFNLW